MFTQVRKRQRTAAVQDASRRSPPESAGLPNLYEEVSRLRARVEHLEDLRELNEAIARNKGKRLIPWEEAQKGLGLEV